MELALHHQHLKFLHHVTKHQPPPITANRRHELPHHVRDLSLQSMPIRDLTIRRFNTVKFHHPKLFCNKTAVSSKIAMADNKIAVDSTANRKTEEAEKKEPEKPKESIPPPPEKPLPDDCCGSGCVRCVWDVYYDELEEYNKLYKSNPDSSTKDA